MAVELMMCRVDGKSEMGGKEREEGMIK